MKLVSRREVIKTFAFGAAFSNVLGKSWAASFTLAVQQAPTFSAGILRIDLNDFPLLAEPFGSVRIGTFPVPPSNQTDAWLKPIIINRGAADDFYVLSAVCTHEGCIIRQLNPSSQAMVCPCHGSQFEIAGEVRAGPANSSLTKFSFTRAGSVLNVSIPDLFFDITFDRAPSATRVQIRFVAFYQTRYEVYFRQAIDGPAELVSFALTETGPANLQELVGNENSEYATMYLDKPGTAGFFQIAIKTAQV